MKLKLTQIRTINRYVLLLVAMFVFSWSGAQAQSITVTGNVTDESGAPLTGVSVIQKGTAVGVVTDGSGKYSINTNASATLLFQYIGYSDQEIAVGGKRVIDVSLAEDVSQIDEVVVVAYGTKKKRDMIGSVAKVKSEDLSLMPGGNFITSLQGKAAGVQIVNDGIPGSNPQIKVRGISSISSGTDPLWVVDGIVGGDYGSVNFHDIESIEVLKDASATAIYGSRGSNGVIIVTTKRGKKGDPIYNVTYNTGVATLTKNDIGMGTTSDYFAVLDRARAARGLSPLDPQKDVIQPFYTGWTSTITRDEALASNPDYKVEYLTLPAHKVGKLNFLNFNYYGNQTL